MDSETLHILLQIYPYLECRNCSCGYLDGYRGVPHLVVVPLKFYLHGNVGTLEEPSNPSAFCLSFPAGQGVEADC